MPGFPRSGHKCTMTGVQWTQWVIETWVHNYYNYTMEPGGHGPGDMGIDVQSKGPTQLYAISYRKSAEIKLLHNRRSP